MLEVHLRTLITKPHFEDKGADAIPEFNSAFSTFTPGASGGGFRSQWVFISLNDKGRHFSDMAENTAADFGWFRNTPFRFFSQYNAGRHFTNFQPDAAEDFGWFQNTPFHFFALYDAGRHFTNFHPDESGDFGFSSPLTAIDNAH